MLQGWSVKTRDGFNRFKRAGQYSQSGQYWSIEILSGRLNIFSGQLEIMLVSRLTDYGYGILVDNLVEFIKYNS